MYAVHREVNVVEELVVVLDAHAGGEEDHHLLLAVLLQEGEQEEEPLVGRAHHVALFGINNYIYKVEKKRNYLGTRQNYAIYRDRNNNVQKRGNLNFHIMQL